MSAQEEEQLRAAYEEELSRISATDMIAQAAVSLLNIGAHRLAPAPIEPGGGPPAGEPPAGQASRGEAAGERDLEQARDAIDAVRALLEVLERRIPGELGALREALARLQVTYARAVSAPGPGGAGVASAGRQPAGAAGKGPQGAGGEGERADEGDGERGGDGDAGPGEEPAAGEHAQAPGPAESSGRLWVPGR